MTGGQHYQIGESILKSAEDSTGIVDDADFKIKTTTLALEFAKVHFLAAQAYAFLHPSRIVQ